MDEAFVGRQPIFDRNLEVYGYELLFRTGRQGTTGPVNGERATSEVILATFTEIGLDRIVDGHRAFINLTREFLLDDNPMPLPKERVVLEVLEDIEVDAPLVSAVSALSRQGYSVALDDFVYHPRWLPLLGPAEIVKVEVPAISLEQAEEHVRLLRPHGVKLLAEKVETREELDALMDMGFDYFQGFFLSRPTVVSGQRVPTNRLATLQLLASLQDPEVDIDAIDALVSRDLTLSYKLLRYINSALFALPQKVDSIRKAVVYIGLQPLTRWASLVIMAGVDGKPRELMRTALIRARMAELLCEAAGEGQAESYFTTGLFSALDAMLDAPLSVILEQLPLSDEMVRAILDHKGPMGEALACLLAYERCEWPDVRFGGLEPTAIRDAYVEALAWASQASAGLLGD